MNDVENTFQRDLMYLLYSNYLYKISLRNFPTSLNVNVLGEAILTENYSLI